MDNFLKTYSDEKEGQRDFYKNYQKYISLIKYKPLEDILIEHTDGLFGGNILEFKLNINNLNSTLFQAIKYLSKARIRGIPVPANILLISLNTREIYKYNSKDFIKEIEQVYIGASSKNNDIFNTSIKPEQIDYNTDIGSARLIEILREDKYTKIHIDEDCILGWAEKFYKEHPKAGKGDFIGDNEGLFPNIGEIRKPYYFKDYIEPYTGKSNEKFKYLMDCLNDPLRKKELGAFYTPIPYCKKAVELVREAIKIVPQGNDYIILDRCAGTGNLESVLTDEELSHCVLSTYEYYEYKILIERLGDKVRYIIPPTDNMVRYVAGNVANADAMSEEYIKNEYLQEIINNPKITIILFENPPYRDSSAGSNIDKKKTIKSFVNDAMKSDKTYLSNNGATARDLSNQFIWSSFKYYIRQPTDSYIVFSPVKYFKSIGLVNKYFKEGFLFNREHFHASSSAISCIWWQNIDKEQEIFNLKAYDIELDLKQEELQEQINKGKLIDKKEVNIKKCYNTFEKLYDKRIFLDDINSYVVCNYNGYPSQNIIRYNKKSIFNTNIIGYLFIGSFNLDSNYKHLSRIAYIGGVEQSIGFYLRSDNFIEKLPLFCAKLYPQENWYERDVYFTTADSGDKYTKDKEFLKFCLIYTCLSRYNKCLSFTGSDNRYYKNELCFDGNTLANDYLKNMKLNCDEEKLIQLWDDILQEAKCTDEYNEYITYGVYQIEQELNIYYKNEEGKNIYNYPSLNGKLKTLKILLKEYYKNYIQDKLFEYELLK